MRSSAMQKISIEGARKVLASNRNIIAAWAFGSAKSGETQEWADLDIAVLFKYKPGLDEMANLRAKLQHILRFEEIDLVVLDEYSSPILRFEALSGRLLYSRDDARCAQFASLTAREYEDEMAMSRYHLNARPD